MVLFHSIIFFRQYGNIGIERFDLRFFLMILFLRYGTEESLANEKYFYCFPYLIYFLSNEHYFGLNFSADFSAIKEDVSSLTLGDAAFLLV